ncbi:hypothetical protein G3O08_16615 [Cryomorpha ignava]|uniref:Uncharacterized protein n=1 Tax=Cryomorpha ignava TaxID=101383 RepID=A0A7K3WWW7_9FLAO|nr:hypothetical protein [Cryomorpha ignava]NEN25125.1 hypothetical protein [Cryomorpha ignava]
MNKQRILSLVLFMLALFIAGIAHFVNHHYLAGLQSDLLREQTTVLTFDDASYLAPAENFIAGKGWKSNAAGTASIATRSPGYGLIYAGFRLILSKHQSLIALVVVHFLLFGIAVALIPHIGAFLSLNYRLSYALAFGVALLPVFSGFLSYTLTEAVTPSLVLIILYGLFRCYRCTVLKLLPIALLLGFLILVRPPMIIWVFTVLILAAAHFREMRFKNLLFLAGLSLLPIIIWQVSISTKTNELQGLHPIYQNDNNDLYRPLHRDIWNFHKSWGQSGQAFNATVNQLWADAVHSHDPHKSISNILKATDMDVINLIGKDRLRNAYLTYFGILKRQVPYAKASLPIDGVRDEEINLGATFSQFRSSYIREHWFYSNIFVPLKVYLSLGAHSNLSLYIFQKSWRGNIFMEMLRYFSFFIHFGIFVCFPFALLLTRKSVLWLSVSIPVLIYLGYICIIQRGVEERYTLPVLIPMLLVVAGAAQKLFMYLKMNRRNQGTTQT